MCPVEIDTLKERVAACGQSHVLACWDTLDPGRQDALVHQLATVPLESIPDLVECHVHGYAAEAPPSDLAPAVVTTPDDSMAAEFSSRGETIIREGKVAAFTVAGGQGTRLGWGGPKGTFPATPVSGKPLFRVFAEQIEAASQRWGTPIRWYIMTSEANDAATRSFFADNNWFGLSRTQVMLFPQGMMPCLDAASGSMLMDGPGRLAMSPDGHGGAIAALERSGALEQMEMLGIEHVSYFQVDNPMPPVIDPVFLGLHADPAYSSGEMSSKMVPKISPAEKVGVFCRVGSKTDVIEYSDLPEALQSETDADGQLRFDAGNIAVHLLGVEFIRRLTAGNEMPWHRALKKVPYYDTTRGERIEPDEPNGVKLERFIFDALPLATKPAILRVDRAREFAPIKNATGADSPASSRQAQSDLYGGWMEARGVDVARGDDGHVLADIEISPLAAMGPGELDAADLPERVGPEERFVL